MDRVSVIIPGRCEPYFQHTIDSTLKAASGDIEIIAIVDGPGQIPPVVATDSRVKVIVLDESIGQRAGYNLGVHQSTGKYVMKIDAHCLLSPGFDKELKSHCPDNCTVIPEMRRLDVKQWKDKPRGHVQFMNFGLDVYCHFWREYRKRPEAKGDYPEIMNGQGSCWFCTKEWNNHIGMLDEGVGSWGNVGIEVALRTWLCGGTHIVNRKAWQAHWFRKDEGGFTYPMNGRQVAKAHKYTRENYFFKDDAFENQCRPFKWIIEKFAPVPGWEIYLADGYEAKRAIVYYTDHSVDENIARPLRKYLTKITTRIPIISVSHTPIEFGKNIVVGSKPRSNKSLYEQMLIGLNELDDDTVVYLCEHDVAYHSSHFAYIPPIKERLDFNQNRFHIGLTNSNYLPARGKWALSQIVAYNGYLKKMVMAQLALEKTSSIIQGARTHKWSSDRPNIDIRHGENFSADGRFKADYYKGKSKLTVPKVGHWGSPKHFWKKIGCNLDLIRGITNE